MSDDSELLDSTASEQISDERAAECWRAVGHRVVRHRFANARWKVDDALWPIEEARAYAKHVKVQVDGEAVLFDEYIKGDESPQGTIAVPTGTGNASVEQLADKINPAPNTVRNRLELLALPFDVQQSIEDGQLKLKPARIIARLRKIPDPDYRTQTMRELATDPRFAGDGPNIDELRETVQDKIDRYEREQEKEEQRLQEFRDLVEERAATTSAWIRLRDNPNRQQIYSH